ncbi:MAG: LysM peptidoglycan-binding domain-containing protein [Deltaproteobacteria bacterium]|nr:LysM peptidoglycan-binding domain-containing protein [Deltaproteobacteria bacterium]
MMRKKYFSIIMLLMLVCLFSYQSRAVAQQLRHTVEKGETLWTICEKYYGDAYLWPKLWQMNPFITNPHFLNPGDVITLLEEKAVRKTKPPEQEKKEPVKETAEPMPAITGVDVSGFTNVKALGYLSLTKVKPWGRIISSDSSKMILSKGDTVFVDFGIREDIKQGDKFTISKSSPLLKHPLTGENLGYTISIHGKLIIKGRAKPFYHAEIIESFMAVDIGDMVIPYEQISSCVQPVSLNQELIGNIVAVKEQSKLIGQLSIVYLDRGFNHGVRRGYLFEVIEIRTTAYRDPKTKVKKISDYLDKQIPLPGVILGMIMVLESRPDTATAVVISVKENFYNGAIIRGLSWVETPEFLSTLPACPIE